MSMSETIELVAFLGCAAVILTVLAHCLSLLWLLAQFRNFDPPPTVTYVQPPFLGSCPKSDATPNQDTPE